jgi:hypothetical protein
MQRSDPIYKPALLLAVLDLLDEGLGTPGFVPLDLALKRFTWVLQAAQIVRGKGLRQGHQPAYHLSTASSTRAPFWDLVRGGVVVDAARPPGTDPALLGLADGIRFHEVFRDDLEPPDGREAVRAEIYRLLEDDARPDCLALVSTHDRDKAVIDAGADELVEGEAREFHLDDPEARKVRSVREHVIRDRTLRLAVLPAYNYECLLCTTRIIWNNLSEVEVAHIKPRSLCGADDPRNALSLCQTHHWAFDLGLWTADDDLRVRVGKPDERRGDDIGAIRQFDGRRLLTPSRPTARPHPDALRWHQKYRFDRTG